MSNERVIFFIACWLVSTTLSAVITYKVIAYGQASEQTARR